MDGGNLRKPMRRKICLKNKTENRALYFTLDFRKKKILQEYIKRHQTLKEYLIWQIYLGK